MSMMANRGSTQHQNHSFLETSPLQSRIDLFNNVAPTIGGPIPAILECRARDLQVLDIIRSLQEVGVQAARYVPRNVTMKGPNAGVVGSPLKD